MTADARADARVDAGPDARVDAATVLRIVIAGRGRVAVSPGMAECVSLENDGADCVIQTPPGVQRDLLAVEVHHKWGFDQWTSGCSGTDPTCTITMPSSAGVTLIGARFTRDE